MENHSQCASHAFCPVNFLSRASKLCACDCEERCCDMNANKLCPNGSKGLFDVIYSHSLKRRVLHRRWLSQGQFGVKTNAHCKQGLVIAMVLKGLTCSHMIVIIYGEGKTGRQGWNTKNCSRNLLSRFGLVFFFRMLCIRVKVAFVLIL